MLDSDVPGWWSALGLPGLIDIHTHFLPDRVMDAVWAYFDSALEHYGMAWPVHYRLPVAERVAQMGMVNSLSQTILKLTVPGVPDIYQGCDLWDFSLVDPDNRRPVDYEAHRRTLASLKGADPREMLDHWTDGRIKLFVTRTLLQHRMNDPELYKQGSYRPLKVTGKCAGSVVAFAREHEGGSILVIVPRLASKVGMPPVGEAWGNTAVVLEDGDQSVGWKNLFTGGSAKATGDGTLALAAALADFPWAVLSH